LHKIKKKYYNILLREKQLLELSYRTSYKIFKKQKYHTVGTIPKSERKIVERDKIDSPNTQIHECSLSWLATGTSMKKKWLRFKLALWENLHSW
jgi:hypothetical protein